MTSSVLSSTTLEMPSQASNTETNAIAHAREVSFVANPCIWDVIHHHVFRKEGKPLEKTVFLTADVIGDTAGNCRAAASIELISEAILTGDSARASQDLSLSATSVYSLFLSVPILAIRSFQVFTDVKQSIEERGLAKGVYKELNASKIFLLASAVQTLATGCQRGTQLGMMANQINPAVASGSSSAMAIIGPLAPAVGIIPAIGLVYMGVADLDRSFTLKNRVKTILSACTIFDRENNPLKTDYVNALRAFQDSRKVTLEEVLEGFSKDPKIRKSALQKLYFKRHIPQIMNALQALDLKKFRDEKELEAIKALRGYSYEDWEKALVDKELTQNEDEKMLQAMFKEDLIKALYQLGLKKEENIDFNDYSLNELLGLAAAIQDIIAQKEEGLKRSLGDDVYKLLNTANFVSDKELPIFEEGLDVDETSAKEILQAMNGALSLNVFSKKSCQGQHMLTVFAGIFTLVSCIFAVISCFVCPLVLGLVSSIFWLLASLSFTFLDVKALWKALKEKDKDFNYKAAAIRILIAVSYAAIALGIIAFAVFCLLNPYSLPVVISFAIIYALWTGINIYIQYKAARQKKTANQSPIEVKERAEVELKAQRLTDLFSPSQAFQEG